MLILYSDRTISDIIKKLSRNGAVTQSSHQPQDELYPLIATTLCIVVVAQKFGTKRGKQQENPSVLGSIPHPEIKLGEIKGHFGINGTKRVREAIVSRRYRDS